MKSIEYCYNSFLLVKTQSCDSRARSYFIEGGGARGGKKGLTSFHGLHYRRPISIQYLVVKIKHAVCADLCTASQLAICRQKVQGTRTTPNATAGHPKSLLLYPSTDFRLQKQHQPPLLSVLFFPSMNRREFMWVTAGKCWENSACLLESQILSYTDLQWREV